MSARRLRSVLTGALWALALVAPAHAGMFDDNEARARIEQLRQRLDAAQGSIDITTRNQMEFANQIEAVRAEMARINGALEVLKYELDTAQKRQQDFYVDLDNRLRKIESQPGADAPAAEPHAPAAEGTRAPEAPVEPAISDSVAYERAVTALKAGKNKEAAAAFDAFIASYPQSKSLPSAHFWNGYARSQLRDHKAAAALFGHFAETWPNDSRAPDALESQAESLAAAKDAKGARAVLQRLAAKYPTSDAGKRARQQLKVK